MRLILLLSYILLFGYASAQDTLFVESPKDKILLAYKDSLWHYRAGWYELKLWRGSRGYMDTIGNEKIVNRSFEYEQGWDESNDWVSERKDMSICTGTENYGGIQIKQEWYPTLWAKPKHIVKFRKKIIAVPLADKKPPPAPLKEDKPLFVIYDAIRMPDGSLMDRDAFIKRYGYNVYKTYFIIRL